MTMLKMYEMCCSMDKVGSSTCGESRGETLGICRANKIGSTIVFIYYLCIVFAHLKNNEKGEALQTNLQPFTYLYCN
jgi:hypothetical protein